MAKKKLAKNIHVQLRGRFVKDDLFLLKVLSIHNGIINLLDTNEGLVISLIQNIKNMTDLSLLVPDLFADAICEDVICEDVICEDVICEDAICEDVICEDAICAETGAGMCVETGLKPVSTHISTSRKIMLKINMDNIIIDYENTGKWHDSPPPYQFDLFSRLNEIELLTNHLKAGQSFFALLHPDFKIEDPGLDGGLTVFQKKAGDVLKNHVGNKNGQLYGLEKLIGLGQGMTPSGDDFITGALFAEYCLKTAVKIDRKTISEKLESTTYAGKTLLFLALQNSFPAYLLTFLKDLCSSPGKSGLIAAAVRVSEHGSTSGLDTLAGFYWYYAFSKSNSIELIHP